MTWARLCAVVSTVVCGESLSRAGVTCVCALCPFFATGELCVSGRNASCLAPSHYLGALSTREVGRGGGGRFEKLETHIVRDIIVRCTCTLFPCCALSDVTSDVCLLLTCAHLSVCALRDVGTALRCSVHCGVW